MKILVADDEPDTLEFLRLTLSMSGYEVVTATGGNEAWAALQEPDGPKLAILDWMMPGVEGPEICRRLRERDGPYVYVILLTARGTKADLVAGLGRGADDFIVKPFDLDELNARIGTGRRILELQRALLMSQKALRFDATHDPLTGVGNRAMIVSRLVREMERGTHTGEPTAVVFADLDGFKTINDSHGHTAGDQVLRAAAERIEASIRPYDALGRYGGDEFLVVLHECDREVAAVLAERIRERVAAEAVDVNGVSIRVTISLGAAACVPGECRSPEALIAAADTALYRAKAGGRNRIEVATRDDVDAVAAHPHGVGGMTDQPANPGDVEG